MDLFITKFVRFFKRVWWKFSPLDEADHLKYLVDYSRDSQYPQIKSIDETIDYILNNEVSLARYGDGEFMLCFDRPIRFQKSDKQLRNRLRKILKNETNTNCIVAIPEFRTDRLTPFWKQFWYENIKELGALFTKRRTYYNQSVTREVNLSQIEKVSNVWTNRDVIFVVGKGSRFDVSHELFRNIKNSVVIYGQPIHAWDNYEDLLVEVKSTLSDFERPIVLCALGPTATVMAYDLSEIGVQALDLGHLPNIYDKIKYNGVAPESLSLVQ